MFGHNAKHVSKSNPPPYNSCRLDNIASGSRSSSPVARSIPSGRKGSKKVRTGCVTCKIRKVKCDETKPFCLRCTKTGRKCDGYLDPRTLTRRRSFKDAASHDHVLSAFLDSATPEEKRALWFWRHCTASCLSGGVDAAFWQVTVLQVCQTEPAVRYAILAVSSLHESLGGTGSFADDSLTQTQQSFALQQYNMAIACLLDQMHNPLTKPLASLLNCILFVCIEYMQGKDKESLIHLEQGRQLLTQLSQCPNDPEMEYIVRHIEPLYTRLSLTSFLLDGKALPVPDPVEAPSEATATFDNIGNTRQTLHEFTKQASRFAQSVGVAGRCGVSISPETIPMLTVEQDRLLAQAAKLSIDFSLDRSSRPTSEFDSALLARQIYLHAQQIWISTALSSSELVYDNFTTSFAAIISLAAAYLDLNFSTNPGMIQPPPSSHSSAAPDNSPTLRASKVTFESITPPLYFVATKCRHPFIRRSALDLLRRIPFRRDNLWQASVMGSLAGHIVLLEERRSRGQILDHTSPPHTSFYDAALYSTSLGAGRCLSAAATAASSSSMPTMTFSEHVGLNLPLEHLLTPSFSPSPSLTTSADGASFSSSMGEAPMAFLNPPVPSNIWDWRQQQHSYHSPSSVPQTDYATQTSDRIIHTQSFGDLSHGSVDYSSPGSSSEISSSDLEEGYHYQTMEFRERSPQQQSQLRQQNYQQPTYTHNPSSAGMLGRQRSPTPNNLVMETPFGLPEEMRVHDDATVGAEREDGTWVAVFRQLQDVAAERGV